MAGSDYSSLINSSNVTVICNGCRRYNSYLSTSWPFGCQLQPKQKTPMSLSNCFKKYSHLKFSTLSAYLIRKKTSSDKWEVYFSAGAANAYEASVLDKGSATVRSRNTTAQLQRVSRFLKKFSHALGQLLGNAVSAFTVPS